MNKNEAETDGEAYPSQTYPQSDPLASELDYWFWECMGNREGELPKEEWETIQFAFENAGQSYRDHLFPFLKLHETASEVQRESWLECVSEGVYLTVNEAIHTPMALLTGAKRELACESLNEVTERIATARTHLAGLPMVESLDPRLLIEEEEVDELEALARRTSRIGVQYIAPLVLGQAEYAVAHLHAGEWHKALNDVTLASAAGAYALMHGIQIYHSCRCGNRPDAPYVQNLIEEIRKVSEGDLFMKNMRYFWDVEKHRFYHYILESWPSMEDTPTERS